MDRARPAPAQLIDCRGRVESRDLKPRPGRDLIAGPFSYHNVTTNTASSRRQYEEEGESPEVKMVATVAPGRQATLAVPLAQRDYMRLLYGDRREGVQAVTLRACRHHSDASAARRECGAAPHNACTHHRTQFAGGLHLDYAKAAGRERCAVLEIWTPGRRAPLMRRLLPGASC